MSNTVLRVNTMSNGDNVGFNLEGDFDTHTVGQAFYGAQRYDNIYKYNIKGRNRKGFSFFTTQHQASNNNQIYLNIDIVSDDHAGVYIGLDGTTLNTDALIIITGRIKVTRAGFPCIVLGANQNNRIVLKDLTLINDGTVSPIMINSISPENIQIQNVVSNSLVSDANILEIGQSIIRNANYQ